MLRAKEQTNGSSTTINDALELLTEANQKLKSIATEAGDAVLDTAKDVGGRAMWMSKEAAQKIDKSAHANAWKFVGLASVVSAVTGYYVGRWARE